MHKSNSRFLGMVLVVFGLLFLLDNLGVVDSEWVTDNWWSIGLIALGIWLVLVRSKKTQLERTGEAAESVARETSAGDAQDRLHISEAFRSVRRDVASKNFAGGRCSVVFGILRLDLTQSDLPIGEQILRLNCNFGKLMVKLPKDLEYSVKANLVASGLNSKGERLGGILQTISVRSSGVAMAERKLSIVASCTFGEIEVI